MFDLDTIVAMNERAHQEFLERARQERKAKSAISPLLALADKLSAATIPSLSALLAQISHYEDHAAFVEMVKTYLPERAREILDEPTPASQIAEFASRFEDRYFPLESIFRDGEAESYGDLTYHIPVVIMGFSYEDYHEVTEWRAAAVVMTYLIESPWEGNDGDVALAEACAEHVPAPLVERAAEIRLSLPEAHILLNGTKYEPLASWADKLHYCTGNFFLDTDYEMLMNSMPPDWTPENVKELTRLWKQAEVHENKTGEFMDWLEEDLPERFEELVTFIEERRAHETEAHE
jgi:hypothetical protein